MLRFTSNNLDLDLTHLEITFTEINPLFQEELSAEYSFPFDLPAIDLVKLNDFTNFNVTGLNKEEKGYLYRDGVVEAATLKIHQVKGTMVSCIIYAGRDMLSLLEVDLKDLPLADFAVPDIAAHALGIIPQQYPQVAYNFPMVFTDKYKDSSDFNGFKGVINNYANGDFLDNEINEEEGDIINNIMQPLPYLMYVLTAGFASLGLELQGDVVSDPDLLRALIFRDGDYFVNLQRTDIPVNISVDQFFSKSNINTFQHSYYTKIINIERKGDYVLNGGFTNTYLQDRAFGYRYTSLIVSVKVITNGVEQVIYLLNEPYARDYGNNRPTSVRARNNSVDVDLQLEAGAVIIIEKTEVSRDGHDSITPDYPDAVALTLYPVRYRNPDGTPIISVENIDAVQLSKVVPDMTLKELVNIIRLWKNLNYTPKGNVITMNYIAPALDRSLAVDLTAFDIEQPLLDYSEEKSFELSFADGSANELYQYDKLYIDASGVKTNTYKKKPETTPVTIDALPLPVITRNGITTALALDDDTSKLRLAFYRPVLDEGRPISYENAGMLLPAIYQSYYKDWLAFRISAVSYTWTFLAAAELVRELNTSKAVFAYGNYHIITELEKARQGLQYYGITVKSESLR